MDIQLQLAGFNLGVVENVVEQAQQRFRRGFRLAHVVQLTSTQCGVLHQMQHAQHRIHRCAYLVTHIGQKGRLGCTRRIRLLLGILQA